MLEHYPSTVTEKDLSLISVGDDTSILKFWKFG